MRRCVCCMLLVCLLILSTALPAYADDVTEYELKDLGMTISLPSDCVVLTRDNLDEASLETAGITKEEVLDNYEQTGIYLEAIKSSMFIDWHLTVAAFDGSLGDFDTMSDSALQIVADMLPGTGSTDGQIEIEKAEIYTSPVTKFIRADLIVKDGLLEKHAVRYATSCDDKTINISMWSDLGSLDSTDLNDFRAIIDSVRFGAATQTDEKETESYSRTQSRFRKKAEQEEDAETVSGTTYTDEVTGVTFVVPENWSETPFNTPKELFKVKFTRENTSAMGMILYGWEELPRELSSEEVEIYRQNKELLAGALNAALAGEGDESGTAVESVVYGDNEYIALSTSSTILGITYPTKMVCYINNRYVFTFQLGGTSEEVDEYMQDFEALLASAQFPS